MNVILFGAGENLINNWDTFFNDRHCIVAVVDNSKEKKILPNGIEVKAPKEIFNCQYDAIYITLARRHQILEVRKQLQAMGVCIDNVWYCVNGSLRQFPKVRECASKERIKPYIFFEVTDMSKYDYGTGIQRTVKNFYYYVKKIYEDVLPLQYFDGFITSYEYEYRYNIRSGKHDGVEFVADFKAGDTVLFPDTSWLVRFTDEDYDYLHDKGVQLCFVVYDLTPIRKREFVVESHYDLFTEWIKEIFMYADSVICISKAVADDLENYYQELGFKREKELPIYFNYLGYDIPDVHGEARKEIKDFVMKGKTFLMVGTVQPLKNHAIAVEALNHLYKLAPESDVKLLIIGKQTNLMADFEDIIAENESVNSKILWIKDGLDEELIWAYENCDALLFPSQAEGFGLPLVEASYFKLPILCSDIPVFREIAGENATYFPVNDVTALAEAILRWRREDSPLDSYGIKRYTWQESAEGIVKILEGKLHAYKVLK